MPLPKPKKGEEQDAYMARCMHEAYGSDAPPDRTQEQAVAMCFQALSHRNKKDGDNLRRQVEPPDPDQDNRDDWISDCVDQLMDEDDNLDENDAAERCSLMWEEASVPRSGLRHKTH